MSVRHVLVTGATGFVGGALVAELLEATDASITCLVRAQPEVDPLERLLARLERTLDDHERPHLLDDARERVRVVTGDVADPDLAQLAVSLPAVDSVWHSAASLKYRDRDVAEIRAHNVEGTRHVLALAAATGAREFNHISTAYVADGSGGPIAEVAVPAERQANNQYERSKIDAEWLVSAAPMTTRTFRPSIVIGHSQTRRAASDAGVYGFLKDLRRFSRTARDQIGSRPLRIAARADSGLNLVPVDAVASSAVAIATSDSTEEIFHLTNGHTAPVREAVTMVCDVLGLPPPEFTDDLESLTREDQLLNRYLDFYLPYLGGERVFDRTHTDAVVGNRCDHPLGPVEQRDIVTTWLDQEGLLATDGSA